MKTSDIENYLKDNYDEIEWDNNLKMIKLNGEQIGVIEMKQLIIAIKGNTPAPHDGLTAAVIKDVVRKMSKANYKGESWMAGMDVTEKGNVIDNSNNNVLLFDQHPDFKGKIYYNEVLNCAWYDKIPLNKAGLAVLKTHIEKVLGGNRSPQNVSSAVLTYCMDHRSNPLAEKLKELGKTWDHEDRMSEFFIKAYECEDTEYIRYVTQVFFFAWVNRILHPGCYADYMFVFEGKQGIGKSKLLPRMLELVGGRAAGNMNFSNDRNNLEKFSSYQLCMFEELKDMKTSDLAVIKDMITRHEDTFDKKFEDTTTKKRSCILVGNVNPEEKRFLKDLVDYERRYIIFPCKAEAYTKDGVIKDDDWWSKNFDDGYLMDVWAEAVYRVTHPEYNIKWHKLPKNIEDELTKIQAEYKAMNDDDVFMDKMEVTLSLPFAEEGYDDYDHFVNAVDAARNKPTYINTGNGGLKWISKSVWRRYVKDDLKESRSLQYFNKAMESLGWKYVHTTTIVDGKLVNLNRYQLVDSKRGEQIEIEYNDR